MRAETPRRMGGRRKGSEVRRREGREGKRKGRREEDGGREGKGKRKEEEKFEATYHHTTFPFLVVATVMKLETDSCSMGSPLNWRYSCAA